MVNLILFFFVLGLPFSAGAKKIRFVECSDYKEVIKEAMEYYLTGCNLDALPQTCARKRKWKYFDPDFESGAGDGFSFKGFTWYRQNRDSYFIKKIVEKEGKAAKEYLVDVEFTVNKKKILTQFKYSPRGDAQKLFGVCGFFENINGHKIYREDCRQ